MAFTNSAKSRSISRGRNRVLKHDGLRLSLDDRFAGIVDLVVFDIFRRRIFS